MTIANKANLLIFVQMLVKERLDFIFVDITHLLRRDDNLVSVSIATFGRKLVDAVEVGDSVIEYTKLLQLVDSDYLARVMRQALVTLLYCGWSATTSLIRSEQAILLTGSLAALQDLHRGCRTNTLSYWVVGILSQRFKVSYLEARIKSGY
ncbi:hypothetical protein CTA1_7401 [Colletotrichum tanaceti]|uniref:Uncharacterized protein n=1 Tax=Colletotrichum tanaceti TaxID=1306861 RepID=A0A4U6XUI5_9PEZI|nr:hypothetical protein CTA1_7401 [Colletotrichum tanaceti]